MARRKAKSISDDKTITRGTNNVFADLGYADSEERQAKLRLVYAINQVIARQHLTQVAAAKRLSINQPKVSALAHYRLDGFSVERLMTFLTALDQDVEIVIRKKRSRTSARISVAAV
ncbi:MAG TPA: helix-turn-helix transcriptional regulator [Candidatus Baltobacteraceae bacterium]|jgi:predicted XRE-type DNA-binding protein|nr:helix-turn-helix transcriptional regulator [Candidatus Baltobacteraceae bacterium]